MFLTTMRVRRARKDTLVEHAIKHDSIEHDLVEVTCHGEPIAVFAVTQVRKRPRAECLWAIGELEAIDDLSKLVVAAVSVMDAYSRVRGVTEGRRPVAA